MSLSGGERGCKVVNLGDHLVRFWGSVSVNLIFEGPVLVCASVLRVFIKSSQIWYFGRPSCLTWHCFSYFLLSLCKLHSGNLENQAFSHCPVRVSKNTKLCSKSPCWMALKFVFFMTVAYAGFDWNWTFLDTLTGQCENVWFSKLSLRSLLKDNKK